MLDKLSFTAFLIPVVLCALLWNYKGLKLNTGSCDHKMVNLTFFLNLYMKFHSCIWIDRFLLATALMLVFKNFWNILTIVKIPRFLLLTISISTIKIDWNASGHTFKNVSIFYNLIKIIEVFPNIELFDHIISPIPMFLSETLNIRSFS